MFKIKNIQKRAFKLFSFFIGVYNYFEKYYI